MRFARRLSFLLLLALLTAGRLSADWRDEVGATRLGLTFAGVPAAAGIVTQAEAGNSEGNAYLPDGASAAFSGKTIVNRSPGSGVSAHATAVGGYFYGNTNSLLPATGTIHAYNADGWINADFLRTGSTAAPLVETARVQNHSWVAATGLTEAQIGTIGQRLDFAINRDGFIAVAGMNNDTSTTLPQLLVQAYNHLTVGRSDGAHSAGFTAYDGAGRIKPDLVAPASLTSYTTPQVASAAGVLAARAGAAPHSLSGADLPRVVKALLIAGATKEQFSSWARTTSRPLDLRYGAGQLNLLLAYRILETGRASASGTALVPATGWAAASITASGQQAYFFEIPDGTAAAPFSAALTWHRIITDGTPGPQWSASPAALVNLDLRLHAASEFTLGEVLDESISTVDNVEHIYSAALAPGRYALVVHAPAGAATTAYALAWRSTPTVTVIATTPEARELEGSDGVFTLTRDGSTATPLLVPLSVGGTAQPGVHYAALPASILIPAGAASVTLAVTPVSDAVAQGDRTVVLSVTGDYSLAAAPPGSATVTVIDKPYDAWRFAAFTPAQLADPSLSGDTADPDFDGRDNLLEYALGGNPLSNADAITLSPIVALQTDGTSAWLTYTYTQPDGRSDLAYTVEWTAALSGEWQAGATVVAELSREPVASGERIVVRAVATLGEAPLQCLRLRVTRIAPGF